jgi:hypothetical protein
MRSQAARFLGKHDYLYRPDLEVGQVVEAGSTVAHPVY